MLLLGLFLGKKCESQPAHLGIYTAHKTDHDHTLAPPAARENQLLPISPQSENVFLPARFQQVSPPSNPYCSILYWCTIRTK